MFNRKEKGIYSVLTSEEVNTLEYDENGKSQVVKLIIDLKNYFYSFFAKYFSTSGRVRKYTIPRSIRSVITTDTSPATEK